MNSFENNGTTKNAHLTVCVPYKNLNIYFTGTIGASSKQIGTYMRVNYHCVSYV